MIKARAIMFAATLLAAVECALPPGYEDEVYCPPDFCIRPKEPRPKMYGGKSVYLECYNGAGDGEAAIQKISTWGPKKPAAEKEALVAKGFHRNRCKQPAENKAGAQATMHSRRRRSHRRQKTGL